MNVTEINPLTLPSLPLAERSRLPNCSAIYFVIQGERILYIGKTTKLLNRWIQHHRWSQLMAMDSNLKIAWLECSDAKLLAKIESVLIKHFQPTLNGSSSPVTYKHARVMFTCRHEVKEELVNWAKGENRTISNLVETLVEEALTARKAKSPKTAKGKGQKEDK